jgi:hypothetical protein
VATTGETGSTTSATRTALFHGASAARLCAVAVTVITIIPHPESPGFVALYRFIEVSYGVACAVAYMGLADLVVHLRRRSTLR